MIEELDNIPTDELPLFTVPLPSHSNSQNLLQTSNQAPPTMSNVSTVQTSLPPENVAVKPTGSGPKPCCVCKDQKAARDECYLRTDDAEVKCLDKVAEYKACMAGYGFKV